jgi:site-specific recombinase XerD
MSRTKKAAPKKSGYYEYKGVIGKNEYGFEIRKSFYSKKGPRDAKEKARKYIEQQAVEEAIGPTNTGPDILFCTVARKWLAIYKKGNVKGNTYYGTYEIPVEKHLIPYFDKVGIQKICHTDIQRFINKKSKSYAKESVKKMMACLRSIFDMAVADNIVSKDPTHGQFSTPKYRLSPAKRCYTKHQRNQVIAFAKTYSGPGALEVITLLKTGISRSELLGLKPENVLPNQCLDIVQGTVAVKDEKSGKRVILSDGLKNKFRKRTIPIDSELFALLQQKPRTVTFTKGPRKGKTVTPEFLFFSPCGKVWDPDNWRCRAYEPFMQAMHKANPDIPILHAHELRHTFATLLKEDGVDDFYIMRMCGWSSSEMFRTRYGHFDPEVARKKLGLT